MACICLPLCSADERRRRERRSIRSTLSKNESLVFLKKLVKNMNSFIDLGFPTSTVAFPNGPGSPQNTKLLDNLLWKNQIQRKYHSIHPRKTLSKGFPCDHYYMHASIITRVGSIVNVFAMQIQGKHFRTIFLKYELVKYFKDDKLRVLYLYNWVLLSIVNYEPISTPDYLCFGVSSFTFYCLVWRCVRRPIWSW